MITSFDSENNAFAEAVYRTAFDVDLDQAVRVATDARQSGNLRFYASCRIADLLGTNNAERIALVLGQVGNASEFRTGFGGTNGLTAGFFAPNYAEGPFSVKGIVEKRLRSLRAAH